MSPEYKNLFHNMSWKKSEYLFLFLDCCSTSILAFIRLVEIYSDETLGISLILVVLATILTVGAKLYLFSITFSIITGTSDCNRITFYIPKTCCDVQIYQGHSNIFLFFFLFFFNQILYIWIGIQYIQWLNLIYILQSFTKCTSSSLGFYRTLCVGTSCLLDYNSILQLCF